MKTSILKALAVTAVVLAVVFGCDTLITQAPDDASQPASDGFATVDSEFSDAPVSPGGTGGTGDVLDDGVELPAEETRSFFTAFQIDPVPEDTAGPKFVVAGDVDQDGLLDLVSGWNQSQPIQLHLQRRDTAGTISFRTINLGGTTPIAVIAGVELGLINDDEYPDVVVLVKASGLTTYCPTCQGNSEPSELGNMDGQIIVLFNPAAPALITDGDEWTEMALVNHFVSERNSSGHEHFPGNAYKGIEESKTKPEWSGFTALAVANIDGRPGDDIVVALNPASCATFGQEKPLNTVDLWMNPGPGLAETPENWGINNGIGLSGGVPVTIMSDAPQVKDIALYDVDGDDDLDVVATYTNSLSLNVRWARNPLSELGSGAVVSGGNDGDVDRCVGGFDDGAPCPNGQIDCLGLPGTEDDGCCTPTSWRFFANSWQLRPVGQVDTAADILEIGYVDSDDFMDVVVRSTNGKIVQWFRRPNSLALSPEFPPNDPLPDRFNFPWQVYTLTEFSDQEPEAIALGDVTGDGQVELMVAVGGGVFWYDATVGESVYDPWFSNAIIQDNPPDTTDPNAAPPSTTPGGTGVGVNAVDSSTHINALLVIDLDGDGKNDIIGTLDRRSGSGLSDDRLVWYRNTKTDEP